ncbi:hyaluronan and proteoglycan link protein 1a [Antennarius striatus]|uniref:hyaluronan and proteoglycan link protein 1a n=1 Tax=Antennarius striatus TaxID=241820 RepID=UPI0035B1B779
MKTVQCIAIISLILVVIADSSTSLPTAKVFAHLGENVTLPCRLLHKDSGAFGDVGIRVKWTKKDSDEEEDVLLSMGFHKKTYGSFEDRVHLLQQDSEDASLVIDDVTFDDVGKYHCEVINGMKDTVQEVILALKGSEALGVVFPYSPPLGRYNLNFKSAVMTCKDQGALVASYEQLYNAWRGGLDWCNAGWLNDGTVQYPITKPREPCGGVKNGPGLRNYGRRDKKSLFDVFCFAPAVNGHVYWLEQPERLSFYEAVQACLDDGAEIANVGQIFAAWKIDRFDRCDAGWLADGSVRYPITRPRRNCSPTEAAVRFVGFPEKMQKSFGVYCYKNQ